MIVFLNYLPVLLLILGLGLSVRFLLKGSRANAVIMGLITLAVLAVLKAVTPSYMPKGTVGRVPLVQPEVKELPPLQDRTLKPEMTNEERAKQFDQKFDAVKQSQ